MCHQAVTGITFGHVILTLPVYSQHFNISQLVSKRILKSTSFFIRRRLNCIKAVQRSRTHTHTDTHTGTHIQTQTDTHTHTVILVFFKIIPKFEVGVRSDLQEVGCGGMDWI
jgi:hypothetical protein